MDKLIRLTTVPVSLLVLLKSQISFMSAYYEVIAVSSKGPMLDEVAEQTGVKTIGVDMTRKITPIKDLIALWQLYRTLRIEKPLMVHTHTPKAGLLGMIAAKMAGVPIRLHTIAGMPLLESTGVKRTVLDLTEKLTYKCATMIYPNSQGMKKIIIANKYCKPDKLKVIGNGSSNGIDTSYFDPYLYSDETKNEMRSSLKIASKDIVYCFIGRIVKDKGIQELVKAFINVHQKRDNVKLLLVGPFERDLDPLNVFTEREIKENPSILWTDFKKDVRPYLSITDIFVFPSYREGFPNVVMQSGAMGLPAIVSNINGCNEIIDEGKNGMIIPVKDIHGLQIAMDRLAEDRELRSQMASVSRQMIIDRYDCEYIFNELLKEYKRVKNEHDSFCS